MNDIESNRVRFNRSALATAFIVALTVCFIGNIGVNAGSTIIVFLLVFTSISMAIGSIHYGVVYANNKTQMLVK